MITLLHDGGQTFLYAAVLLASGESNLTYRCRAILDMRLDILLDIGNQQREA